MKVSEMATIRAAGLDPDDPDSIGARAFLVWTSAHGRTSRIAKVVGPRGGVLYHGNLTSVILDLWPDLSHEDRKDELERFRKEVYSFLRVTGNAFNEQRGSNHGEVVWWLSKPWITPPATVVLKVSGASGMTHKPTNTERKLTPKEAGEDRTPLPVTVTRVTTTTTTETKDTYMAPAAEVAERGQNLAEQQAEKHRQILECIELTLSKAHPEPLTTLEISADLGIHESTARGCVHELIGKGRLFSRVETKEERGIRYGGPVASLRASLYSMENPVPPRTKREVIKGFTMTAAKRTPKPGSVNDASILSATRPDRWERPGVIAKRAKVPQGSSTSVFQRLLAAGELETKSVLKGKQQVKVYKRVVKPRPESPPVVSTPVAPLAVDMTETRAAAIAAVDTLLQSVAGHANGQKVEQLNARVNQLSAELRLTKQENVDLKAQLATIRAALGQA